MDSKIVHQIKNRFDALVQKVPNQEVEFWFARDLQEPLGYARWENFMTAIRRAVESCETMGYASGDHFRGVTKMVDLYRALARQIWNPEILLREVPS